MGYAGTNSSNYGDYYRGDYYRGDYYSYRAGGLLGTIGKVVGGGLKGLVTGGPLGAIAGATAALAPRPGNALVPAVAMPAALPDVPRGTPGALPQPGLRGMIERGLPGGQSGYVPGSTVGAGAPGGYHWNKSHSYARGLPPGSFLVKNRSMNPANARALRRATRRAQGFVALARGVLGMTNYKIVSRTAGAKRGRKR